MSQREHDKYANEEKRGITSNAFPNLLGVPINLRELSGGGSCLHGLLAIGVSNNYYLALMLMYQLLLLQCLRSR